MGTPNRESLANGLVVIGEEAVAKSNDGLFYDYYTDDYQLHSPAGQFNREEIRTYFAALRERPSSGAVGSWAWSASSLTAPQPAGMR
jgi:hypothetical protein